MSMTLRDKTLRMVRLWARERAPATHPPGTDAFEPGRTSAPQGSPPAGDPGAARRSGLPEPTSNGTSDRPAPTSGSRILAAPPTTARVATGLHGAILTTSYAFVRQGALEARYRSMLAPEYRADLPATTSLDWYPMELAFEHYRVMDRLFPEAHRHIEFGRRSSESTQNAVIHTIIRGLAAAQALTPLAAIRCAPRLFARFLQGGAVEVRQTGPKDALLEIDGLPLLRIPYVRNGLQGMFESGLSKLTQRCFVRQDLRLQGSSRMALILSWV